MSSQNYTGIRFDYDEFLKDIDRMRAIAGDFLRPECVEGLRLFRVQVEKCEKCTWRRPVENPVRVVPENN